MLENTRPSYFGVRRSSLINGREDYSFFEISLLEKEGDNFKGVYRDTEGNTMEILLNATSSRIKIKGDIRDELSNHEIFRFAGYKNHDSASEEPYEGPWSSTQGRTGTFSITNWAQSPDLAVYILNCERELLSKESGGV